MSSNNGKHDVHVQIGITHECPAFMGKASKCLINVSRPGWPTMRLAIAHHLASAVNSMLEDLEHGSSCSTLHVVITPLVDLEEKGNG